MMSLVILFIFTSDMKQGYGIQKGEERRQKELFPDCIDKYVEEDVPVRLFDAFVDSLDMDSLKFIRSTPKNTGTHGYDPHDLLRLYIIYRSSISPA